MIKLSKSSTQHYQCQKSLKAYSLSQKEIAESLILTRLDYWHVLFDNILTNVKNWLQKVQNLELKWKAIEERVELSKLIFLFKALHHQQFREYFQLQET